MIRRRALPLLIFLLLLAAPRPVPATEEYAACTGRACGHCHDNPSGGGTLSPAGAAFADAVGTAPAARAGGARRIFFTAVLFAHIATAFMWFGTILYVHLILKPAYAAGGLPRGELRLGWAGILSIALTGTILSVLRLDSWGALLHTRFGLLLSVKIGLFLVMATTAVLVTFVVGPRLRRKLAPAPHPGSGAFTGEDLARFDGREGRRALVAHGGKVHDLTGSRMWPGGEHVRRHKAGLDLTDAIGQAPHGAEKLAAFPVVGTLAPPSPGRPPLHVRGFYLMAYLNLGIVFAVLLVIALWHY